MLVTVILTWNIFASRSIFDNIIRSISHNERRLAKMIHKIYKKWDAKDITG